MISLTSCSGCLMRDKGAALDPKPVSLHAKIRLPRFTPLWFGLTGGVAIAGAGFW